MGGFLSIFTAQFWRPRRQHPVIMVGLDAAGKTTLLYRLKLGKSISTIATMGFNVEHFSHSGVSFAVWDVGGQKRLRTLWPHYVQLAEAMIFVVDSSDVERMMEARDELDYILSSPEAQNIKALLVLANKQDLADALKPEAVQEKMDLDLLKGVEKHIQGTCGVTGVGLNEGMKWLAMTMTKRKTAHHE
eukprot:GILK01004012.1.p1 GENE.GILK01004012.1~~GILK01004012.1.p1  ORF type:complete len:189 (-),score=17.14 GILK01004012.1:230-796(-)